MLKCEPACLMQEIESAEKLRDTRINCLADQVKAYVGPGYDGSKGEYSPENHAYEYLSLTVPRIIFDNPRVLVRSRRTGSVMLAADAIRHGVNRWARDTKLRSRLVRVAYDMGFAYGVILTINVPQPGQWDSDTVPHWPSTCRLSPRRFGMDPAALEMGQARYVFHQWIRDKDDLVAEAEADPMSGWNVEMLKDSSAGGDLDKLRRMSRDVDVPDRREIVGYDIWCPEVSIAGGPDQGFHGALYTILAGQGFGKLQGKGDWARQPRDFYGPSWGPYTMFGVYPVPDSPYPLSPISATEGQARELNDVARTAQKSFNRYRNLAFVDGADPQIQQKVNRNDGDIVPVKGGLDKSQVQQTEIGGVTQQHVEYLALLRQRLDRNSGISEAMRGNTRGSTATAESIAEEASSLRLAFIKQQFTEATTNVLMTAAWYMYHDDRVVFPLGDEAAVDTGMVEPWFHGGLFEPGTGAAFEDLELEIEPYSMERTSEATRQARALQTTELIAQLAPMVPQMPWVDWRALIKRVGDSINDPTLENVINYQLASMMMGIPGAGMMQQPEGKLASQAGQYQVDAGRPTVNRLAQGGGVANRGSNGQTQGTQNANRTRPATQAPSRSGY